MKHIVILFLIISLMCGCAAHTTEEPAPMVASTQPVETQPTLEELLEAEFIELRYDYYYDSVSVYNAIVELQDYLTKLNNLVIMAEGTPNYDRAMAILQPEIDKTIALQNEYIKAYYDRLEAEEHEAKWGVRFAEYPEASQIWVYLKNELGWSDMVCAGVLGNIMAEAGGNTLNIVPEIYDAAGDYYGICQWNRWGYSEVIGTCLEEQLRFLAKTVEYEFNTYGLAYERGFDYEGFTQIEDVGAAAIAFAQCYERCARYTYVYREQNALVAYEYFTN
jgi:hypothetical protein